MDASLDNSGAALPSVLVVDDEQLIRWSIRRHLERVGYRVSDADCGAQALDRFDDEVSVVLLDLKLPDTDGLELLRQFKLRHPGCQVIMMTAYGSAEVESEAMNRGAFKVLNKPFDLDDLALAIQTALGEDV